jgi:hypothetical protein
MLLAQTDSLSDRDIKRSAVLQSQRNRRNFAAMRALLVLVTRRWLARLGVLFALVGGMLVLAFTGVASPSALAHTTRSTVGAAAAVKKWRPKAVQCPAGRRPIRALATRQTLIYGVTKDLGFGPETVYYACMRPHGSAVQLGTDGPDNDEYGPIGTTNGFAIAGSFAAAHTSSGEFNAVECGKYQLLPTCPNPTAWIAVVNVRTLRAAKISVPYTGTEAQLGLSLQDEVPLAISQSGVVAWLQPDSHWAGGTLTSAESQYWGTQGDELWATMLTPQGRSGFSSSPTMIDSGSIPPTSIHFINANTLTWTNGGVGHRQTVARQGSLASCASPPPGYTVLASDPEVVVTSHDFQQYGNPWVGWYGCWVGVGTQRLLNSAVADGYAGYYTDLQQVAVAGTFVGLVFDYEDKYSNCSSYIDIYNLADPGANASNSPVATASCVSLTPPAIDSLVLNSSGFAAWRETQALYAYDSQGVQLIDSSPSSAVDSITNVVLSGNVLTWSNGGTPHQETLH